MTEVRALARSDSEYKVPTSVLALPNWLPQIEAVSYLERLAMALAISILSLSSECFMKDLRLHLKILIRTLHSVELVNCIIEANTYDRAFISSCLTLKQPDHLIQVPEH